MFYMDLYKENIEKSSCLNRKAQPLNSRYTALSSGPLTRLFKLDPWGQNLPRCRVHMLYINPYREKPLKSGIWYVAESRGPTSSKIV